MLNQDIYHFGSPFIDTVIKSNPRSNKDTVENVRFDDRLGGICNSIDIACQLRINTHLIISNENELSVKSLLTFDVDKKYINFHISKNHQHLRAFIFDDLENKQRKSYVSLIQQTISTIEFKKINDGKAIISYIEDFPVKINSLIGSKVKVFADFNNSMSYTYQTSNFKKLIKDNFKRVDYLLFSEDDRINLENFINQLDFKKEDRYDLDAKVIISHDPKFVKFYVIKYLNSSYKLNEQSVLKNNNFLNPIKSSIGNGDLFLIYFTYHFINNSSLKKAINSTMKEVAKVIALRNLNE